MLKHPKESLKAFAVWEPVLALDIAPPATSKLTRLSDARVEQFWDKNHLVSEAFLKMARSHPDRMKSKDRERLSKAKVVWDFIGVFPPRTRWGNEPPFPSAYGAPVVDVIKDIEAQLATPASAIQ